MCPSNFLLNDSEIFGYPAIYVKEISGSWGSTVVKVASNYKD